MARTGRPKGLPKTGGRKKGVKNHVCTLKAVRRQLSDSGFDLIAEVKRILDNPEARPELKFEIAKWVAEYHPAYVDSEQTDDEEEPDNLIDLAK